MEISTRRVISKVCLNALKLEYEIDRRMVHESVKEVKTLVHTIMIEHWWVTIPNEDTKGVVTQSEGGILTNTIIRKKHFLL